MVGREFGNVDEDVVCEVNRANIHVQARKVQNW